MAPRGKRAKITPEGLAIIMDMALDRPRIPRTPLAEQLQGELEAMGQDAPQVEVLERKISWFRNHETDNPQDKPWSTATLDEYPIPPEALAAVLKVWKSRMEKGDSFTIREAKWAARLSGLLPDIDRLSFIAFRNARTDLMFALIGSPFDSTELDRALMGLPVEAVSLQSSLWLMAETKEDQERGIKDGVEEQLRDLKSFMSEQLTRIDNLPLTEKIKTKVRERLAQWLGDYAKQIPGLKIGKVKGGKP